MEQVRIKKMVKKISQIAAYTLLCAIVVAVITCAIVKVGYKPTLAKMNFETDKILITDTEVSTNVESYFEEESYKDFLNKFDNAFKQSVLNSLFAGNLGEKPVMKKLDKLPTFYGFKVKFILNEEAELYNNNKIVNVADNSTESVKYNRVVFNVLENKGLTQTSIIYYLNTEEEYYQFTTLANFDSLYNFIADMPMFTK